MATILALLQDCIQDVKHESVLLWDNRPPSQIVERCEKLRQLFVDLPDNLKDTMGDFKHIKLYTLVFASNKFEGSKISLGDTMRLLKTWEHQGEQAIREELKNTPTQTKKQEPPARREVLQHFLAAQYLCETPHAVLTEEIIKATHSILTEGLLDDDGLPINPGNYRTEQISAKGHVFIDPKFVASSMQRLVETFNYLQQKKLDLFMLAGWLMAEFVTIHPFNDGNGRMCRLLMNYALRLNGLPFYSPITTVKKQSKHYLWVVKNYQKWLQTENTKSKYGALYTFVATVVEEDWENFSSNIEFQ